MRSHLLLALPLLVLTALPAGAADSPQVLLQRMKTWLEPKQTSTRQLAMTIADNGIGCADCARSTAP